MLLYCHPYQTCSTYQATEHDEVQGSEGSEGSNEVQTKPFHPTNQHYDNAIILMTSATATYQLANIGCVPYRQPSGMRRRGVAMRSKLRYSPLQSVIAHM